MKKLYFLLIMAIGIIGCGFLAHKPKGELIYCSYRCSGAAGLGTDYCELIADQDSEPKVVVVLNKDNRFDDPVVTREYPVDRSVADSLSEILSRLKAYQLNGYNVEEPITGGHSYRIHMEYSSGENITAWWYGHKIKEQAITTYNAINYFFEPWRTRADKEAKIEAATARVTEMEVVYNRVQQAVKKKKTYPEFREDVETLRRYMDYGDWKKDFEADERGELPKDLKRGVLSEDGLYNLLSGEKLYRMLVKQ